MQFLDLREPVNAWSHGVWLVLSLPGTFLLWRRSRGDRGKQWSLLIFGMSLAVCYSCSTIYHAVRLPGSRIAMFALMDYIGIYILIAGTYTPIAWNLLQGRWREMTLTLAWGSAALGIAMNLACGGLSPTISTGLYLTMGWGAVFCYAEMARTLTHRTLRPILAGGIAYSVGAVFYLMHWPVLWPGIFADHELFHVLVMAGSLCHYWFMLRVVAPFDRERPPSLLETRARVVWSGSGTSPTPRLLGAWREPIGHRLLSRIGLPALRRRA